MSDEIDSNEIETEQILPQDDEADQTSVAENQVEADEQGEEQTAEQTDPEPESEQNEGETATATKVENNNNNPKPILYNLNISPAVRCVKIVARLINLELELRDLDISNGEHLNEPFIKINPQHTVPTLDDDGFIIWDSHAIATYLIDKYAENDALYPKDLHLRARCNQRLFFNNGILFPRFRAISKLIFSGSDSFPDEFIESITSTYKTLTAFLEVDPYLVGQQLTVADIHVCVIITCLSATVSPITAEQYPEIVAWMDRIKEEIPFFDEMNEPYANEFNEVIVAKMNSNGTKEATE